MKNRKLFTTPPNLTLLFGIALIIFYFLQSQTLVASNINATLQSDSVYRQVTGFLLFAVFLQQWLLASAGKQKTTTKTITTVRRRHEHAAYLLPILLLVHSTSLGYGYQTVLVTLFLITVISGLLHPRRMNIKNPAYYRTWHVAHVSFASGLLLLLIFHIYIVYSYH